MVVGVLPMAYRVLPRAKLGGGGAVRCGVRGRWPVERWSNVPWSNVPWSKVRWSKVCRSLARRQRRAAPTPLDANIRHTPVRADGNLINSPAR